MDKNSKTPANPDDKPTGADELESRYLAEKRMADQMGVNCGWLIERMDLIHTVLCPGGQGTWQQRMEQAVQTAQRIQRARIRKAHARLEAAGYEVLEDHAWMMEDRRGHIINPQKLPRGLQTDFNTITEAGDGSTLKNILEEQE